MGLSVKDPATVEAVRRLAKLEGKGITDTIRLAVEEKLAHTHPEKSIGELLDAMTAEVAKWPRTGLKADKAFFDWLSGEEDVPDVR